MNKRGQSMIEFALIIVLVIVGTLVMGPYVLRSVNAHFKLWDDGVQDSFTENLRQAPIGDLPNLPTNCNCSNTQGACGSSSAGSLCAANQRIYNHSCTPQQCDGAPTASCVNDDSCCTTYYPQGCGTVPIGQTPPSSNCNFGQRIFATQCSDLPVQCNTDPACDPKCLGIISPGAIACPNQPPLSGALTQNYGISYVGGAAACTIPCQYYCENDAGGTFLLNSTGTGCTRTFTVAPWSGCGSCRSIANGCDCSFTMCAGTTLTGISVVASPAGQPTSSPLAIPGGPGEDGCQNPNSSGQDEGEPGNICQISATY